MHNSHQSFAARQRLLNYDDDASNQVIWFTAVPRPAPARGSTRRRVRCRSWTSGCGTSLRTRISAWPGTSRRRVRLVLQHGRGADCERRRRVERDPRRRPAGACTQAFQIKSPPRGSSRGTDRGRHLQVCACSRLRKRSTAASTARGTPADAEVARLDADLPDGGLRLLASRCGRADASTAKGSNAARWAAALRCGRPFVLFNPGFNRHLSLFGVSPVAKLLRFD